jgi:hypothetical protein
MMKIIISPGQPIPLRNLGDARLITINVLSNGTLEVDLSPLPHNYLEQDWGPRQMMASDEHRQAS